MDLFLKLRGMRLLLIDDDEWVRNSLQLLFESEGCRIEVLETAEEALALCRRHGFEIIISDYRLPGMDGIEFVKRLPETQARALKILITAYGSRELFAAARAAGFHEFIPKPFTSEDIQAAIERGIDRLPIRPPD